MQNARDLPLKPKLLICSQTYSIAHNREKIDYLAEAFEICVVCIRLNGWTIFGRDGMQIEAEEPEENYRLERLEIFPKTFNTTRFALKGLFAVFKDFRPNYVLCENEPWSVMRWQCWLAKQCVVPEATFCEFTWENIPRQGLRGVFFKVFYQLAALTGQRFIAGNQTAATLLKQAGILSDNIMVTGQIGVNIASHPSSTHEERLQWRQQLQIDPSRTVIGFCGRFIEEKGLGELIAAVQLLIQRGYTLQLCLLGSGELAESLKHLSESQDWLTLLPPAAHHEVPKILNRFDLLVLPSKPGFRDGRLIWEEQFGHVLIEAMAVGVLTLGSSSGAIPEVLQHDSQVIFEAANVEALAECLTRYLENPELRKTKALAQQVHCRAFWNNEALAKRYEEFLLDRKC